MVGVGGGTGMTLECGKH